MSGQGSGADVDAIRQQRDDALRLLRESPPRSAVSSDRYWSWRRRVEAFLTALEAPGVEEAEAERAGDD